MGWKGTMRSLGAAAKRMEREAAKIQKQQAKEAELANAQEIVQEYERYVEALFSLHRECSEPTNWATMASSKPPPEPLPGDQRSRAAQEALDRYAPGFLDKLLGRVEKRRSELSAAVEQARQAELEEFERNLTEHRSALDRWQRSQTLAARVLAADVGAFMEAFQNRNPLEEIPVGTGASVGFGDDAKRAEARLAIFGPDIVPAEVRSLLQSGRLSVKKMPQARFHEIYRDHVCSAVLRLARELFAFLPLETVLVHAVRELLNEKTGHLEERPVLSVLLPRATLKQLNLRKIDPAQALDNFVHRMDFKKSRGLGAVQAVEWEELRP